MHQPWHWYLAAHLTNFWLKQVLIAACQEGHLVNLCASWKQLLERSKSRIFQRAHQNLIINLDQIFVLWNAIFFLKTLPWWDDFVLKVFLSVRIEFKCVKTGVESKESCQNVAFYGVNWNSGQISFLPPRGFNRPRIKKVHSKWLQYFLFWRDL